ncbi:hypothetical protein PG994_004263 [Apiospora phragmitis]|uniref:Uncharacterized protein n=1 Tax=Apiospora phragmitis TaxID=2905665 RepID=A0ABR1VQ43_9PEZI
METPDLNRVFVDYQGQIRENCEFLTTKDEFISIITSKEPNGKIKAIAFRTTENSEKREPLITSDLLNTVQEAIESLHVKSSEAVQLYIKTNGHKVSRDINEDDADNASVVSSGSAPTTNASSVGSATPDTAAEVIVPFETESASAAKKSKATNGRKARKPPPSAEPGAPPTPTPIPRPLVPLPLEQGVPRNITVGLTITWLRHSSTHILEVVSPSKLALKVAAISYVRKSLDVFENVTDDDNAILLPSASSTATPRVCLLQATVKRAFFDKKSWDITSYQEDLSELLALLSQHDTIPQFEVEVYYLGPSISSTV